jgi:hypothetical protein
VLLVLLVLKVLLVPLALLVLLEAVIVLLFVALLSCPLAVPGPVAPRSSFGLVVSLSTRRLSP